MVPSCLPACALKVLAHSARSVDEVINASVSTWPEQGFQQCPPRPHRYVDSILESWSLLRGAVRAARQAFVLWSSSCEVGVGRFALVRAALR